MSEVGVEIEEGQFARELAEFKVTEAVLDEAIHAANAVLAKHGAAAAVSDLGIAYAVTQKLAGCVCKAYRTRCTTMRICDPAPPKCRLVKKCWRECARWECDT